MDEHYRPTIAELLERLNDGLEELEGSEAWRRFLAAQARFPRYSYANTLLILQQRPDASAVAGYATWRGLGRWVREGERAIWIVAPVRPSQREVDEAELPPYGFRRIAVFDVSQTEGVALASLCTPLEGTDDAAAFEPLVLAARSIGFSVEWAELPAGHYGDCTYGSRRIRVSKGASPVQAVKTLAHELAHALLHEDADDRRLAELEAESIAYVVCQRLGIESAPYSFGYVATWAGGTVEARSAIRHSCRRISETSRRIFNLLEGAAESRGSRL